MAKFTQSSFDVHRMVRDLQSLVGGFLEKAYQPEYTQIVLRFNSPTDAEDRNYEKKEMLIQVGEYIILGKFDLEMPKNPSPFPMTLRKHLSNARVKGVRQHEFDRIFILEFETKEGNFEIVVETFANGNVILVKDDIILKPLSSKSWRHREVKAKQEFKFPPPRANPMEMDLEGLKKIIYESDGDLVRTLVSGVNLPPIYSEELCLRCGFEKDGKAKELTPEAIEAVFNKLQEMFDELNKVEEGFVYYDGEDAELVSPIKLENKQDLEMKKLPSFFEAMVQFEKDRSVITPEEEVARDPEIQRLKRLLEQQESSLGEFDVVEIENRLKGDAVYGNFKLCEEVIGSLLKAKEQYGWEEVEARALSIEAIKQLNTKDGYVIVPLKLEEKTVDVKLDLTKDVNKNASIFYEKAKKAKEKTKGDLLAIEETKRKLAKAEKEGFKKRTKEKREATRKYWFDRYRWFISTTGVMVLAGKDASTNDRLVKKHMDTGDRYAHADLHGAPSVVIKKLGEEAVDDQTLVEACHFALSYSKAWNSSIGSGTAYWVKADQVSKTPVTGEYLAKGAFIVRGKRNIVNDIPLTCAVGVIEYEGRKKIMGGPPAALEIHSNKYIVLTPGTTKVTDVANELSKEFNVVVDDVLKHMPPGGVEIIKRVGF